MTDNRNIPYAAFGERLTKLRKAAGITRAQLGEACGVAQSTISNYEKGLRIPYADTAVKMADYFHITVHELLGVDNPELAMSEAAALDRMREINGRKGEERLKAVYREARNLAGGDLSEDQLLEFSMEMNKMAMLAQQRLREMHTNRRYQDAVEAKGEATAQAVREIDESIRNLASEKK